MKKRLCFVLMTLLLVGFGQTAHAVLQAVGPTDPVSGFPKYYQDTTGLILGPCFSEAVSPNVVPAILPPDPAATTMCGLLSLNPQVPPDPFQTNLPVVFPTNFPEEWFYWNARACDRRARNPNCLPGIGAGGNPEIPGGIVVAEIRFSLEGSFATIPPLVANGQQATFSRTRINFTVPSTAAAAGTYTVTTPFGVRTFPGVTAGQFLKFTEDIPVLTPLSFAAAVNGNIGPFLRWTPDPTAILTVGGNTFIGDPGVLHTVTGSPTGTNLIRIDGPVGSNIGGPGIDFVQTDLFFVMGQVFVGAKTSHINDFDGDGKTDTAVWRGANGNWFEIRSSNGGIIQAPWGTTGDVPVTGDYDGDGKTDLAVWRPSDGNWYITPSSGTAATQTQWGTLNDIPVPGDYDGDGKTDIAVWRPSDGTWYITRSSGAAATQTQWGVLNDKPVAGDYDGDGKTDLAVWRPADGNWYIQRSSDGVVTTTNWGTGTLFATPDVPVPGDYDGDGKTDLAVWRPADGNWYIKRSSDGVVITTNWGTGTFFANPDIPVPGDYDGDGKTDIAVWRPADGNWYIIPSSTGSPIQVPWGGDPTDVPIGKLIQ